MTATNGKVLSLVSNTEMSNMKEERVFSYLRNFIGDLCQDELFLFLQFVMGTPACTSKPMQVTFNSQGGATRRQLLIPVHLLLSFQPPTPPMWSSRRNFN